MTICETAAALGLRVTPELTVQINSTASTPDLGYPFAKQLLARKQPFTALFAYNDISAIGAMWAFREAGLRIPEDISVVGFDDIPAAAFASPGLTTVRQPLERMGQIAAKTVIDQIEGRTEDVQEIVVEPEFVVRGSTGPARSLEARPQMAGMGPGRGREDALPRAEGENVGVTYGRTRLIFAGPDSRAAAAGI